MPELNTNSTIQPSLALIFHTIKKSNGYSFDADTVITKHAIFGDDSPQLGAGTVVAKKDMAAIARKILNKKKAARHEFIPSNVLSYEEGKFSMWVTDRCVKPMLFHVGGDKYRDVNVPWPRLLFIAKGRNLEVFAIKGDKPISPTTVLYHAPLMNIGSHGSVCIGGSKPPVNGNYNNMPKWENIIYKTAFTHENHKKTLKLKGIKSVETNHIYKFYKELAIDFEKGLIRKFPMKNLVKTTLTVGDILDAV